MGVRDLMLVEELTEAAKASHVRFDDDEREFVQTLRGLDSLDREQRQRARRLFRERVDW